MSDRVFELPTKDAHVFELAADLELRGLIAWEPAPDVGLRWHAPVVTAAGWREIERARGELPEFAATFEESAADENYPGVGALCWLRERELNE